MIGVFDSGLGGLSILSHLLKDLPNYNYIYLGDNANVPYGNKSADAIYSYSQKAVDFLSSQGCQLIIFACNSASSQALRRIQQEYLPSKYPKLKVLGLVRPVAEKIASLKNLSRVGLIGTKATVNSSAYEREITQINPKIKLFSQATPLLVPLIEEGWIKKPETKMILKKYLRPLKEKKVQALILACTHYPFLLNDIKRIMGKNCIVFDSGQIVSHSLVDYLSRHQELKFSKKRSKNVLFYTTDDEKMFKHLGEFFLGGKIENIEKIKLN